jgi:sporulation protein YqfC
MTMKTQTWLKTMSQRLDVPAEAISGAPRITLSGDGRVLVEGHRGLLEYAQERIAAAGRGCKIIIKGEGLRLLSMNRHELVVTGHLWAVELE